MENRVIELWMCHESKSVKTRKAQIGVGYPAWPDYPAAVLRLPCRPPGGATRFCANRRSGALQAAENGSQGKWKALLLGWPADTRFGPQENRHFHASPARATLNRAIIATRLELGYANYVIISRALLYYCYGYCRPFSVVAQTRALFLIALVILATISPLALRVQLPRSGPDFAFDTIRPS